MDAGDLLGEAGDIALESGSVDEKGRVEITTAHVREAKKRIAVTDYAKGSGAQKRLVGLCLTDKKFETGVFWSKIYMPAMSGLAELEGQSELNALDYQGKLKMIIAGWSADPAHFLDLLKEAACDPKLKSVLSDFVAKLSAQPVQFVDVTPEEKPDEIEDEKDLTNASALPIESSRTNDVGETSRDSETLGERNQRETAGEDA